MSIVKFGTPLPVASRAERASEFAGEGQGVRVIIGKGAWGLGLLLAFFLLSRSAVLAAPPTILRIAMTDEHAGWGIAKTPGDYAIVHTTDSGRDWKIVSPPSFSPAQRGDSVYADEQGIDLSTLGKDAWVTRVYGPQDSLKLFVWRTVDGGLHWSASKIPVTDIYGLFLDFVDSQHGFLLGTSDSAMGHTAKRVYRTSDGGKTWKLVSDGFPTHPTKGALPFAGFPTGISFRDAKNGWVGMSPRGDTDVTLYRTKDGGQTWSRQMVPPLPGVKEGEYDSDTYPPIFFLGGLPGVLPVQLMQGERITLVIYFTGDGGEHWTHPKEITGVGDPSHAYSFTAQGDGRVVAKDGAVIYVSNDGKAWQTVRPVQFSSWQINPTMDRLAIDFVNAKTGWLLISRSVAQSEDLMGVMSDACDLLLTRDGGAHWTGVYHMVPPPLKIRRMRGL